MKKVALYIRVSTVEQAKEGFSIEGQKDKLVSYCKAKDWVIQDIYIDDGYTGTNTDRPALQALLKNMDKFNVVLVYKLDRLSRSQRDVLDLVEGKFLENNVDFVSLLESFDTSTPFGRAMLGILAVFAQLDREMIIERMKLGKERRAKEGYWRGGGNVPIGYRFVEVDDELVIDAYEAMQVRKVFKLYLEGNGAETIANYMKEKGYKNNNGYDWNANQVIRTLKNKVYIGMIEHNGKYYKGRHKPIIDKDVFNMVQTMMNKHKQKPRSKYLLGGIIYCKYCGARLRSASGYVKKNGSQSKYYNCYSLTGPKRMAKTDNCIARFWRAEELEGIVIKQLSNTELSVAKLKKAYELKKGYLLEQESQQDVIMDKIRDIDNNIDKLMKLYQEDKIPVAVISDRIDKLYKEKLELQNSLSEQMENPIDDNFEMYMSWLKNFEAIWEEATFEEKRVIITSLIKRIDVGNTPEEVTITWNDL